MEGCRAVPVVALGHPDVVVLAQQRIQVVGRTEDGGGHILLHGLRPNRTHPI